MRILDLGCGDVKVEGATGPDNVALTGVDIVHDLLSFPYPLKDGTFDIIYLRHVIEHFDINEINLVLNVCHRILQNPSLADRLVKNIHFNLLKSDRQLGKESDAWHS